MRRKDEIKYSDDMAVDAVGLCMLGYTNAQLAEYFQIGESTFYRWLEKYPVLREALKQGREIADQKVAKSLYQRAIGYSHPDVHISNFKGEITETPITKHYPPDTTAAIFWLKNRQRQQWRDKVDHEVTGRNGGPLEVTEVAFVVPGEKEDK